MLLQESNKRQKELNSQLIEHSGCERNVLANNDFRLRCDARRSFRRAIKGEFLDAAMFLSTRCFSRTFSKFGSEAGQFFSRLLVGHCHTEERGGEGKERRMEDKKRDAR
ncbi:hypothetical protein ALC53_08437 [Atta colombica]|uniref:Uncharacterized protein n=1 Tax=Atta colombica TaxID=520822 RepID=A0A195B985_9HYME|nr:hypothetical protein ALC53_08437 [Atta colombica]